MYCGGMFIKITTSGGRRYIQLVESYRDESGRVKKRTVATLGRADQVGGQLQSVIRGLQRLRGDAPSDAGAVATMADVRFESSRALGDVWALTELWDELGFGELRRVFGRTRSRIDVEALVRLMVLNRLCDPTSKLGVLRWLQTVALPRFAPKAVTHQQLLRAMDALVEHQGRVQAALAGLLRPLIDQDLSVVFYDMTTIGVEGETELAGDLRQFGLSKDGGIRRQFMLGVVQTAEGLPLMHRVWEGNTAEAPTLSAVVQEVLALYPVKRVVLVADRALLAWTIWSGCASNAWAAPSSPWSSSWPCRGGATASSRRFWSRSTHSAARRPPVRSLARPAGRTCAWSGLTIRAARRNKPQRAASISKNSRRRPSGARASSTPRTVDPPSRAGA